MALGLGTCESTEADKGLHKLTERITGQCGLLFTDHGKEKVLDWFENYSAMEYARSGHVAPETVIIPEGPQDEFCHSIEPHIRKLGMPSKLEKGVVSLYKDYTVCKKGQILTPEQAKILKLIAQPIATFRLTIKCHWAKGGSFEAFVEEKPKKAADSNATDSGRGEDVEDEEEDEEMDAEDDNDDES